MEKIKVKKIDERATLPTYGTEISAGADLYALSDGAVEIAPHETKFMHTGLSMEIPSGYVGFVCARSGIALKRGLAPANKVGVVDSDYRGEIMVAIHNHTNEKQVIENGERVAQIIILPYLAAEYVESDSLSDTQRGEGGFGSTGNK